MKKRKRICFTYTISNFLSDYYDSLTEAQKKSHYGFILYLAYQEQLERDIEDYGEETEEEQSIKKFKEEI